MARVYEGDRPGWIRFLRPVERGIYRICRVRAERRDDLGAVRDAVLVLNLVGIVAVYLLQRFQGGLPWNPQALPAVGPLLAFNTAVSFVTNTNWQSYGGRDDAELPDPDARPDRAELRLGRHRDGRADGPDPRASRAVAAHPGQLLGRSDPQQSCTSCCRSPCPRARRWSHRASCRRSSRTFAVDDRRSAGRRRRSRWAPPRPRSPSSSSAPTAAASSTRTPPTRFENPDPAQQPPRDARDPPDPGRPLLHVRPHGRGHPAGLGDPRRDDAALRRLLASWPSRPNRPATPILADAGCRRGGRPAPGGRQHGGQGDPLRHRQLRALGHGDDGGVERVGQRDARLVHAARRAGRRWS